MSTLEFVDPPETNHQGRTLFTDDILDALRASPCQWACIKRAHPSASALSNYSRNHPEFETTCRLVDGMFDLYARFIGSAS